MHRALCQIKISSINSAIATNWYIRVSICSLQHSHNYLTTKYPQVVVTATHPQVVHYNTPRSCSLQHTHRLFTTTYPQVVQYLEHTFFTETQPQVVQQNASTSLHCNTPTSSLHHTHTFFIATHPQVVHCNTPTSCSLQDTQKLFIVIHPQVVHCYYNTPASGSLYIIPTCDYRQRTSSPQ